MGKILVSALASASLLSLAALAGGEGEAYPSGIRVITATEATSDCIGNPRTPVCAVETDLTCVARKDLELCRQVSDEMPKTKDKLLPFTYSIETACYFIPDTDPITSELNTTKVVYASVGVRKYYFGGDLYYYILTQTPQGWKIIFMAIEGEVGPIEVDCTLEPPPRR